MSVYTQILSDEDEDAGIHIGQLGEAISVWAWMQQSDTPQTVASAAITFNTTPQNVRDAIKVHPWAFLTGYNGVWSEDNPMEQFIEHDGE